MGDVVFVAIMLGFFLLAGLFVRACDRIIGAGEEAAVTAEPVAEGNGQVAA